MTDGAPAIVFLNGPVGAGKTTLGRALALRLAERGAFLDGDDYQPTGRPWFASVLTTSRAIVQAGLLVLERHRFAVIAYPLRRREWVFHRCHFSRAGVRTVFVTLQAPYRAIVAPDRGRAFSAAEHGRIATMLAEGYGARPFSDLIVDTDRPFAETLDELERGVRALLEC